MPSGDNFGYEPPSRYQYDGSGAGDYVAPEDRDRPGEIYSDGEGQPQNDVESATIDELWLMVTKESDEYAYALAEMWRRLSTLLEATRDNLTIHGNALAEKWRSPAAEEFLRRVGGGLASLEEWKVAADRNASTLRNVALAIGQAQRDMRTIWADYQEAMRKEIADKNSLTFGDIPDLLPGGDRAIADPDAVKREYTERARAAMRPLAQAYLEGYIYGLARGNPYQGPTNAEVRFPGGAPTRPGGAPTAPGAPPGAAPVRPAAPPLGAGIRMGQSVAQLVPPAPRAPRPSRPAAPTGPTLARSQAPPPASTAPTVPTALGRTGAPPPAPVLVPGPGLSRGAPPVRPTLPPSGTPATGAPARPMLPPGAPRLSGRQGAPATPPGSGPGAGGRPGAPALPPGAPGAPRGARPGAPPAATSPSGRGGSMPAVPPGAPGTRGRARPAEPPALGRNHPAAPGTGRPGAATPPFPGSPGRPGTPVTPGAPLTPGAGMPGQPSTRGVRPGEPKPAQKATPKRGVTGSGTPATPVNAPLSGRQKPAGRGTAETGAAAGRRAGVRPDLEGRGVRPAGGPPSAVPAAKQRRRGRAESTFKSDLTEDEKLWKVDESAPAVIDHQAEPAQKAPKPALGSA